MELFIKNMVCRRCITSVEQVLAEVNLHVINIELGSVRVEEEQLTDSQKEKLESRLNELGFELLDSAKSKLMERIKSVVIEKIHHSGIFDLKTNWSQLISEKLNLDYNYLSALFSSVEGVTVEHFIIAQKIERAKELLLYDEFNLSEIAFQLGYSSVQYLSTQFKQVTGQTPSQFKASRNGNEQRKPLDSVK